MDTNTNSETSYTLLTETQAAIKAKCPRCRRGYLFKNKMYSFKQTMYDRCPHCNLKFEREPGYFYVSMFVSYALNVAEMVAVCVAIYVLTGSENPMTYIAIFLLATFILSPFNFRYSRVILLYWLTPGLKFSPEKAKDLPLDL